MTDGNKYTLWKNKKNGHIYRIVYDEAIECTNGREDTYYIVYTDNDKIFVRQASEFYEKFERMKVEE